jgi:hypothetical protein
MVAQQLCLNVECKVLGLSTTAGDCHPLRGVETRDLYHLLHGVAKMSEFVEMILLSGENRKKKKKTMTNVSDTTEVAKDRGL